MKPLTCPLLRTSWFLLLCWASAASHGDSSGTPQSGRELPSVNVATGLVSVPREHTYRVMLTKAGRDRVPVGALLTVIDQNGKVVRRSVERLTDQRSVVLDLPRHDLVETGPVQLKSNLKLRPLRPGGSCPLTLTIQTLEGDHEDGPFETCPVDPCCPGCGPGGFAGVQIICGSSNPTFTVNPAR